MIYRFDSLALDLDRAELRRDGTAVPVEPQVFALLSLLVRNSGKLLTKDEINAQIWAGRVVSDAVLNSRIKSARQAIGDDGKSQRLIRTIHRKGYRFVGEVVTDDGAATRQPSATEETSVTDRPTVVVLPFTNLSSDAEQEYFSDAITQDIIATLSKHRWLAVIARNTSFGYKGRVADVQQLQQELGVDYVVEGSVRRAGSRIRVAAELIDARTGNQQWADRYDRELEDIFALQDEITERIVARLEPEIGFAERQKVVRAARTDLRAWDCYHLGIWHFFKFTADDNLRAQQLLQRSRELDPSFGEAHAWWAYAVILGMVYWDTEPSEALLEDALSATTRALDIDDQNAVFYALKGRIQLARREYASALVENEMAIQLNPSFAAAHCGLADSLCYEGRYDESIARFRKAIDLSPNDPQRWAFLTYGALALIFNGEYEQAIEWAERASEIPNCQYWTLAHKAVALAHLGRPDEAHASVQRLLDAQPSFSIEFARKKLFYLKDPEQLSHYVEGLHSAGVPDT